MLWINAVQIAMGLGLISRVLKKLILTILLVLVLPLLRSGFPGSWRSLVCQARWRLPGQMASLWLVVCAWNYPGPA